MTECTSDLRRCTSANAPEPPQAALAVRGSVGGVGGVGVSSLAAFVAGRDGRELENFRSRPDRLMSRRVLAS